MRWGTDRLGRVFGVIAPGVIAIIAGAVAAVVLFVPFVAISYRRRGTVTTGRAVLWSAALVYFWAIWTYTLLPLPDGSPYRCAGVNLDPTTLVRDIRGAFDGAGAPLADPALLQLGLNVLLFVPLGVFLRILGGRGVLVSLAAGLGVSLFVETTQLTGVWGLYPCAYRVFDVVDLLTNTAGAVLGSVLALAIPARHRGMAVSPDADRPRPVTRRRRVLAMACDLLAYALIGTAAQIATQLWLQFVVRDPDAVQEARIAAVVGVVVGGGVALGFILSTGRSIGDLAVRLSYRGGPLSPWAARPLRAVGGVAGFATLDLLPGPWDASSLVFAAVALVVTLATPQGRGLPGMLSGQRVTDARGTLARR